MEQAFSEADAIAAVRGTSGIKQTQSARSLLCAAESLQGDAAWLQAAITLLRQAGALAAIALCSRRNLDIEEGADVSRFWDKAMELPELQAALSRISTETRHKLLLVVGSDLKAGYFEWPVVELQSLEECLLPLVRTMVSMLEADILAKKRLRTRVATRWGVTVAALLLALGYLGHVARTMIEPINIAPQAHITASSVFNPAAYDPKRLTDGNVAIVGYHSQVEEGPWVLFDFRGMRSIQRVIVTNRLDGEYSKGAVPLVIETSADGKQYQLFARQNEDFKVWTATGPRTKARFVRLTIPRKAVLHLNEVAIH